MLGIQGGLPDDEPPARGDDVRPSLLGGVQTFFLGRQSLLLEGALFEVGQVGGRVAAEARA